MTDPITPAHHPRCSGEHTVIAGETACVLTDPITPAAERISGVLQPLLVSSVRVGDVLVLENYIGRVTMLNTYNLGAGDNWPCLRIFLSWGSDGGRGFARFPHETVLRLGGDV